jgi:hypothetical protein
MWGIVVQVQCSHGNKFLWATGGMFMNFLDNNSCGTLKKCLLSEVPSPFSYPLRFKQHSSTVQSVIHPTENLVETVGTAVTVLENVMSMVTHSRVS